MAATVQAIRTVVLPDDDADASFLEQEGFEDRLAEYRRGDFGFVGVRLVAELHIPNGEGWIYQSIMTPGLWGVEDDSSAEYLREVAEDEYTTLCEMLTELGIEDVPSFEAVS